ncbi:potassium channel protein [Polymorphobacter arshaanensis]|uniref:Potassium channel protein n=1 Tax=Glacieibacterium arshaanense TaxID=2511025 RepID=A0A4Y9EQA2_9SPHN|nr:potassium channel family protein [Polymorphobacter arshaanensis]TFU05632.1 potassium channel protein [Polymorphobacter arshaanensis]
MSPTDTGQDETTAARRRARSRLQSAQARVSTAFRERMLTVLLVLLLLLAFVVPSAVQSVFQAELLVDILLTLVLIAGTMAVSANRPLMMAMAVLAFLAMGLRWSEWILPGTLLPIVRESSVLITLFVLAIAVAINVFSSSTDISERIVGTVILYLLIGMIWGIAYMAIATRHPDAFAQTRVVEFPITNWIYFSFVTLTTVGYGDVLPVSRIARSLATLEALIGQLYPAIIIARMVSMPRADS